ncbi:MAG: flavodoxin family protein [Deltaproteobacteria bacterium]|nr:flavodoxin family protein [Deltaproteobacteria bacterium]
MKVIAFNGSGRKGGNTAILLETVLNELSQEGIETECIQLAGEKLQGCIACYKCFKNKDQKCSVDSDNLNTYLSKMIQSDGILLGSPVYFTDVTPGIKALIDRCGLVSTANGGLFKRKVGAAVVAVRRAGAIRTFDTLNHLFLYNQMIIPGSTYWNVGIGRDPGEVKDDQEGIQTMKALGKNMAWLLKKLHS